MRSILGEGVWSEFEVHCFALSLLGCSVCPVNCALFAAVAAHLLLQCCPHMTSLTQFQICACRHKQLCLVPALLISS